MKTKLERLPEKSRRGTRPRCHWITDGGPATVASRLTSLIAPHGAVTADDFWMPGGFVDLAETDLGQSAMLLGAKVHRKLRAWWFVHVATGRTPNIDIASTCTVNGSKGLLLVGAKAHVGELTAETHGRALQGAQSGRSRENRARIGDCIAWANKGLLAATTESWNISRDSHYQMANRFAWAWKLATLGLPVILVYLGFLNAVEMRLGANRAHNKLLTDHDMWRDCVRAHGYGRVPWDAWESTIWVEEQPIIPLIRSIQIAHDAPLGPIVAFNGT